MTLTEALKEKGLTEVEIEAMVLLRTTGGTCEEIAEKVFRTKRAVQWRFYKCFPKIGVKTKKEAILWMAHFPLD